jgi:hypothetical protein
MPKRIWNRARTAQGAPRASKLRMAPRVESLEARQMLSGTASDYVLSGYSWSNPSHITYSFPADGTPWDGGTDNLNAAFAAQFQNASWARSIAKALQTWASIANINVVPVADSGAPFNTLGLPQGDPRFGDIRIGGYDFQSSTVLAQSYNPPPNGLTGSGDVEINTGFYWGPNAPYDLYSVLLHETGLALGMGETADPTAVMNRVYGGVRSFLDPNDIAGIQAIDGPRVADPLQALNQATAPGTAFDVTTLLAPSGVGQAQTTIGGLSLDRIGDTEYFSVVAPAGAGAETLAAVANPQGLSSLSPAVVIYNAAMQPIVGASNPAAWSNGVIASAGGIVPGHRYIVAVTGATNDVFSVGAYNFQLTFKGVTGVTAPGGPTAPTPVPPTVPPPPVTPPNTNPGPAPTTTIPKDRFEPNNTAGQAVNLGTFTSQLVAGLTIYAPTDMRVFNFVAATSGTVAIETKTTNIWAVDQWGRTLAVGTGQVSFPNARAGTRYWIVLGPANWQPNPGFSMAIAVVPPAQSHQQVVAPAQTGPAWSIPIPLPSPTPSGGLALDFAPAAAEKPVRPAQRANEVYRRWWRPL